jgi:protein N-terminal methyltransferase
MKMTTSQSPFEARKMIHFHLSTLQTFDPSSPFSSSVAARAKLSKRAKLEAPTDETIIKPLFESTYSALDGGDDKAVTTEEGAAMEPVKYDVIWCQWCLQHLSDKDLVSFLIRSKASLLKPSEGASEGTHSTVILNGAGIIVVKENVLRDEKDGSEKVWYDDEDHSITRTSNAYERVFRQAGLVVIRTELQLGLPEELFPVRMWALRDM